MPGDCYLLYGDVGAGKSYFSRAFIRAAESDDDLPVPSPTYLLHNSYADHAGPPIGHYDLYRLAHPRDLARLDLAASLPASVSLIEWPERLGAAMPSVHLAVRIAVMGAAEQAAAQARLGPAAAGWGQAGTRREEWDDEGGSGDEEEEDGWGCDRRWRRIELEGRGERWRQRLEPWGKADLREGCGEAGLWLYPEGKAGAPLT